MDCPFSGARLHELHWPEKWSPAQISVLAGAITGEVVGTETVLGWLREAGIAVRGAEPVPKPVAKKPAPRPRARARGGMTLPCDQCGAPVTREPSRVMAHVFCSAGCSKTWRAFQARVRRLARKSQAARDLSPEKRCPGCQGLKPLSAYHVDVSRGDGRSRTCRACHDAKSRAYYARNRERLQARARERKARLRGG